MRVWAVFATLLVGWLALGERATEAMRGGLPSAACANAAPVPAALRLPARVPPGEPVAIEQRLLRYLSSYAYRDLGWCVDKAVRDTGPYLDHVMYGTHTAVRIYYSPEMMAWLRGGRRGVPADGAVIIKEQYGAKPAAAFAGQGDATLRPTDWTIMIRRSSASRDGWFWGEVWTTMFGTQPPATTVAYPNAGFGLYCLRCHASAARALTFSALENVRGFPGEPLRYRVDDSWRFPLPAPTPCVEHDEHQKNRALASVRARCAPSTPTPLAVQTFPPESLDTNLAAAHGGTAFLTSAQCMSCHSAAAGAPFGPTMWVTPAPSAARQAGLDVSEFGEWRWSPMGLAGRDPVFYAQLQSELTYLRTLKPARVAERLQTEIDNTCLHCHGAMGERTLQARHPGARFDPAIVFDGVASHPDFALGGLARDGVSCTICHHAAATTTPPGEQPLAHFLATSINGDFRAGPADRLDGPFKSTDVAAVSALAKGDVQLVGRRGIAGRGIGVVLDQRDARREVGDGHAAFGVGDAGRHMAGDARRVLGPGPILGLVRAVEPLDIGGLLDVVRGGARGCVDDRQADRVAAAAELRGEHVVAAGGLDRERVLHR